MSKTFAHLLGKTEEEASRIITKLEALSGYASEDVRLFAELKAKTISQVSSLGLDHADVTPRELQKVLQLRLQKDNELLSRALGVHTTTDSDKLADTLVKLAEVSAGSSWALKKHVAKDLLRQSPPKKLMRHLGYRSFDSMIKREDITELYAALPFVESGRWLDGFWKKHSKLKASDFETRPIEFRVMSSGRWSSVTSQTGLVTCMLQLGSAVVWPLPGSIIKRGVSLSVLLFDAIEIMRIYSASLKLEQVKPDFGRKVIQLMQPHLHSPVVVEGAPLAWNILHSHYGKRNPADLPLAFDPHLQANDLHTRTTSQQLAALHPAFCWWAQNDALALVINGQQISLNLSDVLVGSLNNSLLNHNFIKSLWSEMLSRYLKHSPVENYILSQLDNYGPAAETISTSILNTRKYQEAQIQAEFA